MSKPSSKDIVWVEMGFPGELVRDLAQRLGCFDPDEQTELFTRFLGNTLRLAFQTLLQVSEEETSVSKTVN